MINDDQLKLKEKEASEWVLMYSDLLYAYTAKRIKDNHTAKDIVQDTFLAAWRNVDNYNQETSVKTWLFAILKNKIIDYHRKQLKVANREVDALSEDSLSDYFVEAEHWAPGAAPKNWQVNQNDIAEKKEFYNILNSCKRKLKEVHSIVFSLKYLDGLESEDICKMLSITSANYWVIIHRAKLDLRACLEKNLFIK